MLPAENEPSREEPEGIVRGPRVQGPGGGDGQRAGSRLGPGATTRDRRGGDDDFEGEARGSLGIDAGGPCCVSRAVRRRPELCERQERRPGGERGKQRKRVGSETVDGPIRTVQAVVCGTGELQYDWHWALKYTQPSDSIGGGGQLQGFDTGGETAPGRKARTGEGGEGCGRVDFSVPRPGERTNDRRSGARSGVEVALGRSANGDRGSAFAATSQRSEDPRTGRQGEVRCLCFRPAAPDFF